MTKLAFRAILDLNTQASLPALWCSRLCFQFLAMEAAPASMRDAFPWTTVSCCCLYCTVEFLFSIFCSKVLCSWLSVPCLYLVWKLHVPWENAFLLSLIGLVLYMCPLWLVDQWCMGWQLPLQLMLSIVFLAYQRVMSSWWFSSCSDKLAQINAAGLQLPSGLRSAVPFNDALSSL